MKGIEFLDTWIGGKVRSWSARFAGEARSPELLEIRRELLSDVRNQIKPAGKGRFVFPYRAIHVQLAADTEGQRQLLESAFIQSDELQEDSCSLLTEVGCPVPAGFYVNVTLVEDPSLALTARPFRIQYSNTKMATTPSAELVWRLGKLTVVKGEADPPEYVIRSERVNLGRLKEVLSETGSLRRRNDVAFAQSETTVSREHAYLICNRETGVYRVHDCRSQGGTTVFREARELRVPRGSPRGLELQSGDEIHLGQARLRFELIDPETN